LTTFSASESTRIRVQQRTDQRDIFRNRLFIAAGLLLGVVVVGAAGFRILGHWPWEDCVYFTIITLSTVGFGETLPGMNEIPWARVWTVTLIFLGSGTLVYFVSTLTAFIVEGDLQGALRRNRMQKRIGNLNGHYIVCGIGSTGIHVVEELINTHHPFVVIDRDEERIAALAEKYGPNKFYYVIGDATDDDTLVAAGIERALGIIAALTDDKDNLYITISAAQLVRERALKGAFRIVAKAIEPSAQAKLRAAGAHRVVSPSAIGGMRMVSEMIRPAVVEFLDLMLRDPKKNLRIEEVAIPETSRMVGRCLKETRIRQATNVLVIAVKYPGETPRYEYNPRPDLVIERGMILIVLAETVEMNRLRDGMTSDAFVD
jgi:voltage-gated potassium channel